MITTHIPTFDAALRIAAENTLNTAEKRAFIWTRTIKSGEQRYCITTPDGQPHPEPESWHQAYTFFGESHPQQREAGK